MSSRLVRTTLLVALLSGVCSAALADPVCNRVSALPVATNVPEGKDRDKTTTSAEIITVSKDGNTLVYSDSPMKAIGFIDISNAHEPKALGSLAMDGEPTSVAVAGSKVLVAVNTSESKAKPSGRLAVVDLAKKTSETTCDLGGQPDSVAVAPDGSFAAIAIENERDKEVNEGALPQMPAGYLVVLPLKDGAADCSGLKKVDMTGLAAIAGEDPEPEFVAINEAGEIALTLQENNHIVIIDGKTAKVTSSFSAGSIDLTGVDVKTDGKLDFTGKQEARLREPDADLGHVQHHEGRPALALDPLPPGLLHRAAGHGERQLRDDDVGTVVARQIHAFGKARQPEQRRRLAPVDALLVPRDEFLPRNLPLHEHPVAQDLGQLVVDLPHLPAGREQHQCARLARQHRWQALEHFTGVGCGIPRMRLHVRNVQDGPAGIVEGGRHVEPVQRRVGGQSALLQEWLEAAAGAQRG